jgi:hypothetical protein
MKSSEKKLVGLAILAAGIFVVFSFGLPQWDTFTSNNSKSASLQSDLKATETERDNLNLQISLLQKNIDIPTDIQVKTFTNGSEEQAAKELLDHVVNLATGAGNKFVSLGPVVVEPFLAPPKPPETNPNAPADTATTPTEPPADLNAAAQTTPTPGSEDEKAAALAKAEASLPPLLTKGYDLTIRGTYGTLQSFLRAMDQEKMVMDMLSFDLQNEAASGSTPGAAASDKNSDPNYPLRLKITLRLALQRVETLAQR